MAGIVSGSVVDIVWLAFLSSTGIYELAPGFLAGLIVAVAVALCTKAPSPEVEKLYDSVVSHLDEDEA